MDGKPTSMGPPSIYTFSFRVLSLIKVPFSITLNIEVHHHHPPTPNNLHRLIHTSPFLSFDSTPWDL